jgi:hypothetical protein
VAVRLPNCCALFPLVVGELLDLASVGAHDEDVTVWLWVLGIERFVLESGAAAREHKVLAIWGEVRVGINAVGVSEAA